MSGHDTEIEWLKERVSCGELLERLAPAWRLDRAESTRRSLIFAVPFGFEFMEGGHDGHLCLSGEYGHETPVMLEAVQLCT